MPVIVKRSTQKEFDSWFVSNIETLFVQTLMMTFTNVANNFLKRKMQL